MLMQVWLSHLAHLLDYFHEDGDVKKEDNKEKPYRVFTGLPMWGKSPHF